ncbi:MAG: hypothetical protein QOD42_148, partial [Sphingomonadales bacterium]|nr:hypothetical protein [Sphingomonadales bacterium]
CRTASPASPSAHPSSARLPPCAKGVNQRRVTGARPSFSTQSAIGGHSAFPLNVLCPPTTDRGNDPLPERCSGSSAWPRLAHIDRRGVEPVLDVRGAEVFDHLDAGAAVFGDLVDVGALHQAEADVPQAVEGSALAFAIGLQSELVQERIEQLALQARKQRIGRLAVLRSLRRRKGITAPGMLLQ